ncbi:MAG: peptidase M28, partial [Bryobacteraceae bacterium]
MFVAIALAVVVAQAAEPIRAERMRADLTFLASAAMEGRLSLDRGGEVAVEWLVAEFKKAGLEPQVQRVPLIEYRVDGEASELVVERGGR